MQVGLPGQVENVDQGVHISPRIYLLTPRTTNKCNRSVSAHDYHMIYGLRRCTMCLFFFLLQRVR
jgi:hypothetical protein